MRQAGVIAAGALYALDHNIERLAEDHQHARTLADAIRQSPGLALDPEFVDTNIVFLKVAPEIGTAAAFCARLRDQGVWTMALGPQRIRAVTHLDVSRGQTEYAARVIQDVAAEASAKPRPGDQLASLAGSGVRLENAPAVRIATKPYNGVPSKNGWSELHMVALDGAGIVGIDSTLIVLWRQDSAEEWGTGASGSLLDFGKHRTSASFVTSSEFAFMERFGKLYNTPFGLFPLSDAGPLAKDAASLQGARDWLLKYKEKPEDKLQAVKPGRC